MVKSIKRRRVSYKNYKAKHPNLVVMYSQPDYVEVAKTPDELRQWTKDVVSRVGISFPTSGIAPSGPLKADDHGHTNTGWTDSSGGRHLDFDCE